MDIEQMLTMVNCSNTFSISFCIERILYQSYFPLWEDIFTWKTRFFAWKALSHTSFHSKWMGKKGLLLGSAIGKRECARYRQFISAVQAELISVTTARGQSEWVTVTRWDFWSHRAPTERNVSAFFFHPVLYFPAVEHRPIFIFYWISAFTSAALNCPPLLRPAR